jgi:hypothetical protein
MSKSDLDRVSLAWVYRPFAPSLLFSFIILPSLTAQREKIGVSYLDSGSKYSSYRNHRTGAIFLSCLVLSILSGAGFSGGGGSPEQGRVRLTDMGRFCLVTN